VVPDTPKTVGIPRGTVILANVFDPQGRNPKERPLVVVEDFEEGDPGVFCVAVTSALPNPIPAEYVTLPWHRDRRVSRTGLTARCAAVCTWRVMVTQEQVVARLGQVPNQALLQIVTQIQKSLPEG
jgi:hypothetical protein